MAKPPSEYVTLISSDGFEFVLPRSTACVSGTIRRMLDPSSTSLPFFHLPVRKKPQLTNPFLLQKGSFSEAITGRCVLENIKYVQALPPFRKTLTDALFLRGFFLVELS
jgi:hypothetical protein